MHKARCAMSVPDYVGIRPLNLGGWWTLKLRNIAGYAKTPNRHDLGFEGIQNQWARTDLNCRPHRYQRCALPTELRALRVTSIAPVSTIFDALCQSPAQDLARSGIFWAGNTTRAGFLAPEARNPPRRAQSGAKNIQYTSSRAGFSKHNHQHSRTLRPKELP